MNKFKDLEKEKWHK